MLALDGLRYRYSSAAEHVAAEAVAGVDLEVGGGELCALVGANGSGKTTLLRLAALTLAPTAGRVVLFGQVWRSPRQVAARVAWSGQNPALDPTMTGVEHLRLQAALMGLARRTSAARIAELVAGLRLEDAVDRFVATYSGGMRRRLHLALGLLHEPELLLLDEPTAGLDPEGQALVWRFLTARAELGKALVIVTHDLARVLEHATTVVFLDAGKVAGVGPPESLAAAHGGELHGAYTALTGRDGRALHGGGRGAGRGGSQGAGRGAGRA
jgi:ABC-2 type transport system ATP-binding protein